MKLSLVAVACLALGAWCGDACAQGSFVEGDVYLVSAALEDPGGGTMPGVMHIDPATWVGTVVPFPAVPGFSGRSAYDPFRDRLVLMQGGVLLMAPDGSTTTLPTGFTNPAIAAPTGDGRIYFIHNAWLFSHVDAAGATHQLLDVGGAAQLQWSNIRAMTWDPGTNALFITDPLSNAGRLTLTRLTLSPDGSQVQSIDSVTLEVSTSGEIGVGFSRGPGSSLFLAIDTNSNATEARLVLIDPTTLGITTFASPGYFGAGGEIAGAYVPSVSRAVVVDSLSDQLRSFAQGSSGEGVILPTAGVSGGGSGEQAQLVVIARACPGGADLSVPFGVLDFNDVIAFLTAFGSMDPAADLALPSGVFDFNDVIAFLTAFGAGCP